MAIITASHIKNRCVAEKTLSNQYTLIFAKWSGNIPAKKAKIPVINPTSNPPIWGLKSEPIKNNEANKVDISHKEVKEKLGNKKNEEIKCKVKNYKPNVVDFLFGKLRNKEPIKNLNIEYCDNICKNKNKYSHWLNF